MAAGFQRQHENDLNRHVKTVKWASAPSSRQNKHIQTKQQMLICYSLTAARSNEKFI